MTDSTVTPGNTVHIVFDNRGDDMDDASIPVAAFSTHERAATWIKAFAAEYDDLAEVIESEFSIVSFVVDQSN